MKSEKLYILLNVLAWLSLNATEKWRFTLDSHSLASATFVCTSRNCWKIMEYHVIQKHLRFTATSRTLDHSFELKLSSNTLFSQNILILHIIWWQEVLIWNVDTLPLVLSFHLGFIPIVHCLVSLGNWIVIEFFW